MEITFITLAKDSAFPSNSKMYSDLTTQDITVCKTIEEISKNGKYKITERDFAFLKMLEFNSEFQNTIEAMRKTLGLGKNGLKLTQKKEKLDLYIAISALVDKYEPKLAYYAHLEDYNFIYENYVRKLWGREEEGFLKALANSSARKTIDYQLEFKIPPNLMRLVTDLFLSNYIVLNFDTDVPLTISATDSQKVTIDIMKPLTKNGIVEAIKVIYPEIEHMYELLDIDQPSFEKVTSRDYAIYKMHCEGKSHSKIANLIQKQFPRSTMDYNDVGNVINRLKKRLEAMYLKNRE